MPSERWPKPSMPSRYQPELATLVKAPPEGDDWLHEIKFDGYRFGCRIDHGEVKLITRNGHDWTSRLPYIAKAAAKLEVKEAFLDGEVCVVDPKGKTDFHGLQEALSGSEEGKKLVPIYFVFDLFFVDGQDASKLGTELRKAKLQHVFRDVPAESLLKFSDHLVGRGAEFFANAKKLGLEGIVSKKRSATYRPGRTTDWLKTKAALRQEFVICGFVLREASKDAIGSLILGLREGSRWAYSGHVGTGFTQADAERLWARLHPTETPKCPFPEVPDLGKGRWGPRRATPAVPRWVKPTLVCEVAFTEWTPEGTLRHPSFQGLREDKDPTEVGKEG